MSTALAIPRQGIAIGTVDKAGRVVMDKPWYDFFLGVKNRIGSSASSGIPTLRGTGAPASGAAGDGAGINPKYWLYVDETNSDLYLNAGTILLPSWKLIGREA